MAHFKDFDDSEDRRKKTPRHAKNFRGEGMRIINKWSEESFDSDDDFEYNANTTQTHRTYDKETNNGY